MAMTIGKSIMSYSRTLCITRRYLLGMRNEPISPKNNNQNKDSLTENNPITTNQQEMDALSTFISDLEEKGIPSSSSPSDLLPPSESLTPVTDPTALPKILYDPDKLTPKEKEAIRIQEDLISFSKRQLRLSVYDKLLKSPSTKEDVDKVIASDPLFRVKYKSHQKEDNGVTLQSKLRWCQEQGFDLKDVYPTDIKISLEHIESRLKMLRELGISISHPSQLHGLRFYKIMRSKMSDFEPESGLDVDDFPTIKKRRQKRLLHANFTPVKALTMFLEGRGVRKYFSREEIEKEMLTMTLDDLRKMILNRVINKRLGIEIKWESLNNHEVIPHYVNLTDSFKIIEIIASDNDCVKRLHQIDFPTLIQRLHPLMLQDFLQRLPFVYGTHISIFFKEPHVFPLQKGVEAFLQKFNHLLSLGIDAHAIMECRSVLSFKWESIQERTDFWIKNLGDNVFRDHPGSSLNLVFDYLNLKEKFHYMMRQQKFVPSDFILPRSKRRRFRGIKDELFSVHCVSRGMNAKQFLASMKSHPFFDYHRVQISPSLDVIQYLMDEEDFSPDQMSKSASLVLFPLNDVREAVLYVDSVNGWENRIQGEKGHSWRSISSALDFVLYKLDITPSTQLGKYFLKGSGAASSSTCDAAVLSTAE